jgi:hypothetical protein
MSVILQICAAVITVTFVVLAIVTIRAITRFEHAADSFSKTADDVRETLSDVKQVTQEMHEVVESLGGTAKRSVKVGNRASDLSSAIVEEVAVPVQTVVALSSGIRNGAGYFLERIMERFGRRSTTNDGE